MKLRNERYLADMEPGALVHDWVLDTVLKSIHRITGAGHVLLYPGTLGGEQKLEAVLEDDWRASFPRTS